MAPTPMDGCRKGWHVTEMLSLVIVLLNSAGATTTNHDCNSRCYKNADPNRPPNICFLPHLCPISASPPALGRSIVARMHVQYQVDGCADPLEPLTAGAKRHEVHGFWLPKLFGAASTRKTLQLELRHLQTTMLDRPVVIAIMADVSAMNNVTVEIDMRSLSLTGTDLRFIVSAGVVVCGVASSRLQVIRNVFKDATSSFSWLWKQHNVIHTFISGSAAGLVNDVEHITLNIGNGYQPRQDATHEKSCRDVRHAPAAEQAAALDHMMTLTRLEEVRSTKPAKTVIGCTFDNAVAAACPAYKIQRTPDQHLFVVEVYKPYLASGVQHAGIDGDTRTEIQIEVDVRTDAVQLSGASRVEHVKVALINRSHRSVCWKVKSHGLNSNSLVDVMTMGGLSSVEIPPGEEIITRSKATKRLEKDLGFLNNHSLLATLQNKFRTTITAYAQTHEATLFQLLIPNAAPAPSNAGPPGAASSSSSSSAAAAAAAAGSAAGVENPRCVDTGIVRHTACVPLSSAVTARCSGALFSVSVSLAKLRASGWDTAAILVTLGDEDGACALEPVAGDDAVLALSVGQDRCGIAERAKGRGWLQSEIFFKNASCPGTLCAGNGSSCALLRRQVHRVQLSCLTDARNLRRGGRLTAYRTGKFITPFSSWEHVTPGQEVFFELDLSSKMYQGVAARPVDCDFYPKYGHNSPVMKDGCAPKRFLGGPVAKILPEPSLSSGVRRFRTKVPLRDDVNPVVALVCTVTLCSLPHTLGSHRLCEDIDRNCIHNHRNNIEHRTNASSGLLHVLPATSERPTEQATEQPTAAFTTQQSTEDGEQGTFPQAGTKTAGSPPSPRTGGGDVSTMMTVVLCASSLLVGAALPLLVVLLKREVDSRRAQREEAAELAARRVSRQSGFEKADLRRQSSSLTHQHAYLSSGSREISSLARSLSTDTSVSLSNTRSASTATTSTALTPDTES